MRKDQRTTKQSAANEIDRKLFKLIGDVEFYAKETKDTHWTYAASDLREARARIRLMMHKTDILETL